MSLDAKQRATMGRQDYVKRFGRFDVFLVPYVESTARFVVEMEEDPGQIR